MFPLKTTLSANADNDTFAIQPPGGFELRAILCALNFSKPGNDVQRATKSPWTRRTILLVSMQST